MYDELIEWLRETSIDFGESDHVSVMMIEAADAIKELSNIQIAPEKIIQTMWIPVTERLPERNYNCLVADDGTIVYGYMNFIGEWMDCLGDKLKHVSHWMPLPQPPEDGES